MRDVVSRTPMQRRCQSRDASHRNCLTTICKGISSRIWTVPIHHKSRKKRSSELQTKTLLVQVYPFEEPLQLAYLSWPFGSSTPVGGRAGQKYSACSHKTIVPRCSSSFKPSFSPAVVPIFPLPHSRLILKTWVIFFALVWEDHQALRRRKNSKTIRQG